MYHAVIEFNDGNNSHYRFKDGVGASSPLFRKGDGVTVLYVPDDPDDAIIDRGIWNWGLSAGFGAAGVLLLLLCGRSLIHGGGRRRFKTRV